MKKLIFAACALAMSYGAAAQTYAPVAVTGYNADVVADGSGTVISSTTHDVDGVNYNFVAQNFVNPSNASPTSALPNNGTITSVVSATPGLTYQLAPYSGNNSLRISGLGTGTLTFAAPAFADQVFVLATSGSGASTSAITVNFTDGTSQTFTQVVSDWYDATGFAIQGISRVNRTNNAIENSTTNPRLYQYLLPISIANTTRSIQSITFNKTTAGGVLNVMGVSVRTVAGPTTNDAGILAIVAPTSPVQSGIAQPVQVTLVNQGTANLTSATINWSVDGVAQTPFAWTGNLALNQSVTITIGTFTFSTGAPVVNACAANPNNTTDGFAANDCSQVTLNACNVLSGVYTINNNAPASAINFISLNAALTAMTSCGVSGPVTFNVAAGSGPYAEQLDIPAISGASATNTITFNGNGATISANPASATRALIKLNGADYITIHNFNLSATGTTSSSYGWGIHFINGADNNTISNNTITIGSTSATESTSSGIVFSNSATSVITTGNNGSNNVISGNTITGGYNGIVLYGQAGSVGGNQITGNTIKDFYQTGVKLGSAIATLVENNDISRPTRTSVTTFEGVTLNGATQSSVISKNLIHNSHGGTTTLTGAVYGIYSTSNDAPAGAENLVKNNLIYGINNTGTIYGLYNSGSDGIYYYHNTVNLDNLANTGTNRAFYQTTTATNIKLRNNILVVAGGTGGVKHAVYYGSTTSDIESDRNNLFVSGGASGSGVGYYTSNRVTLTDWQTASSDDANSVSADPLFAATTTNYYTPTNVILNNIGSPVTPAVTDDITGVLRSTTTPDPGAYEFTVASVDLGAVALSLPGIKSCYGNAEQVSVTIQNWGSAPLDFTTTNARLIVNVSGAATQTFTVNLNNNTLNGGVPLAAAATLTVPVGTLNMTAPGKYTFNASTTITSGGTDGNPANNAMATDSVITVVVNSGVASATQTSLCQNGTPVLNLAGHAGGNIQWQQATTLAGPYADITGATSAGFTASAPITATTYYRSIVSCGANSDTSNVITITVNNPAITASAGATRCGTGSVTLSATPSAGATINWYDAAAGGLPVATGTTYSPNVTATTTYYATATTGGGTFNVGPTSNAIGTGGASGTTTYYQIFDVLSPLTLDHVYVYPSAAGNVVLHLSNNAGVILQTFTVPVTAADVNQKTLIPINYTLAPGTGYRLGWHTGGVNLYRNTAGASYPYTIPGLISITGSSFTGFPQYYYYVYDFQVSNGCESARTAVVATVTSAPTVNLGADITQCGTSPVILDAGNAGATYQWNLNGNAISGATSQTLSATASGTYSVTVTANGCSGSDDVVVNIGNKPATPVITLAAGGSTTFCQGETVTLNGATTTSGVTYSWSRNGVLIAGAASASYTANQAGNYRVIATTGTCSDSSAITVLTVNPIPATPVISQNGSILTSNAATGNQWFLNGNPVPAATGTIFTPVVSGAYTVVVTANGCSSVASNSITITISGINEAQAGLDVSIYPNPSNGNFTIQVPAGKTYDITVTDLAGKLIKQHTIQGNNTTLNLQTEARGIYLLQIRSESRQVVRKLLLE